LLGVSALGANVRAALQLPDRREHAIEVFESARRFRSLTVAAGT
jgi:hypothetical protein